MEGSGKISSPCPLLTHYDVLLLICDGLDDDARISGIHPCKNAERDLLHLGLACKSFFDPAMDILWWKVDNLLILFKTIPNFILLDGVYNFQGSMTSKSLERFDTYARRMRGLRGVINPSQTIPIDNCVCAYLANQRHPTIIPALKVLEIDLAGNKNPEALFLLTSPTLTTINLFGIKGANENVIANFLQVLSESSRSLEVAKLEGSLASNLFDHLAAFPLLSKLELRFGIDRLTDNIFLALSTLPCLKFLNLKLPTILTALSLPLSSAKFDCLRYISVWSKSTIALAILRSLHAPHLEEIHIILHGKNPRHQEECKELVAECASATRSVKRLHFTGNRKDTSDFTTVPHGFLNHLFLNIPLQNLIIKNVYVPMDDDDIRYLCRAGMLDDLRSLSLTLTTERSPTISSLRTLAARCPNLLEIELCFDLQEHHISSLENEMKRCPPMMHKLAKLTIGKVQQAPLNNLYKLCAIVALYLNRLFPYLQSVQAGINMEKEWCDGINAILGNFRAREPANDFDTIDLTNDEDTNIQA